MDLTPTRYEDAVILSPTGRINHSSSEAFAAALRPHMDRCKTGGDRLVLDLARLEYISSAGLRVLMLARKQAQTQGGTLVVAGLGPMLREIFEISRFSAVFDVYATVREALAEVSPPALAAFERA